MWINSTTGTILLTHSDIRSDSRTSFPSIITDDALAEAGYLEVTLVQPVFNPVTQVATELAPVVINGTWTQQWSVANKYSTQAEEDAAVALHRTSVIEAKWEAIKTERDRREAAGVLVGTKWFHTDEGSRIKQLGLVIAGANLPSNLQWKTMDGSFVTMTPTLAGQVFGASLAKTSALYTKAEELKAAMEASGDPSTYDITTGWPKVYGDT